MVKIFMQVVGAVSLFAGVHSLLASRQAKQQAAAWLGQRQRNGFYRLFYLGQSVVTLAALLAYIYPLPDRVIYRASGAPALLLRLGQLSGLVFAFATAWQVGLDRILGLRSLAAWLRRRPEVPAEPEAQGPSLDASEFIPANHSAGLKVRGPFRASRHPLNLAPLPVFWLTPNMTVKRLAFNLAGTVYLILGSIHEETRLRKAYGDDYRQYQYSGVPFYFPLKFKRGS